MKTSIALAILWMAGVLAAFAQGTNPLNITCPPNQTNAICGVNSTVAVTYPPPIVTGGNCTFAPVVTCSPPSGALFIPGTTTVTCTATNVCGQRATCTFTVTVVRDTVPPVIDCPTNLIVWLCGTNASNAAVTWPRVTAVDNLDPFPSVTCTPSSGSLFPLGTTTVTCVATDDCTNRTTCTFTVTVMRDTVPPVINCPPNTNITACLATGVVVNYPTPTATDNADPNVTVVCSPASGSVFPVGSTTVTCTATDDCTNKTICTFTVTVARDTTPPTITCPANISVVLCGTTVAIPVNFPPPTAFDSLDPNVTVTCVPPSGSAFPPGTNTVVCTATDDCGNTRSCSFTVTVIRDVTPPSIVCPTNMNVIVASCGATGAVVNFPMPVLAVGVEPETRISCVPGPGTVFPLGTTTVTCTAEDVCGNRDTCTFTVTVRPRPFFDGLCHTPLGLAALNVNPAGELEVSGIGASGEDGVRIELGESQGLRWQMRLPTDGEPDGDGDVDGRDFLARQRAYGQTTAGAEILVSEMAYAFSGGQLSIAPSAASYKLTLLRNGAVVFEQNGRTGAFDPPCTPVWNEHCFGESPQEFPDNPLLPHCMFLLGLVCDVETPAGPVQADAFIITPEDPLPSFTAVTAIHFQGRNVPLLTLRQERLLMFGGNGQPPRPHRALGQARLIAEGGALTVANLGPAGSGASVEFYGLGNPPVPDDPGGGYIDEDFPPTAPGSNESIHIAANRTEGGTCADSMIARLSLAYLDPATAQLTLSYSACEIWELYRYQVYLGGVQVGGGIQSGTGPLATLAPATTGLPIPTPSRLAKYPLHLHTLGLQMRFEHLASFTLQNGATVIGDEIRVLLNTATGTPIPSGELSQTVSGFPSFTITGGGVLRPVELACPPDIMLRVCSTNRVPVHFETPVVTGGYCASPFTVVCTPRPGFLFPPGTNVVQCVATNPCGESAECSFTVTIHADAISPTITCPTNMVVHTLSSAGRVVCYPPPTVSEMNAVAVCDPPSGSVFPIGTNQVTCTVMDVCGNQQSCQFTIEVRPQSLEISQSGPLQLSWEGDAELETARDVAGPWLKVQELRVPYHVVPDESRRFFRLRQSSPTPSGAGAGTGPGDCPCGQVGGAGGVWNFDVPSVRVQGAFRLNGQPFPASILDGANFFLRNATTGDEVYLGLSNNDTFDRRVVPGKYDVIYEHKVGQNVPLNSEAIVQQIDLVSDQVLNIDVSAAEFSGDLTLNGEAFPQSPAESGKILVRDQRNGARTEVGDTTEQSFSALLILGRYDVLYDHVTGSFVPANRLGTLRRDVSIAAAVTLDIDVATVELRGEFFYDGLPAPSSPAEDGEVYLVDTETQGETFIGVTRGLNYAVNILPGDYDLKFKSLSSGAVAPANSNARFQRGVTFLADTVFDVDVPTVTFSGEFKVNGLMTPDSPAENARVWLRDGKDRAYLGETRGHLYQIKIIPGEYEVVYEAIGSGAVMPANTNTVVGSRQLLHSQTVDIDIPAVTYLADVRFNGATLLEPPGDDECRIYLENVASADPVYAGVYPDAGQLFRVVIPGIYRVRYEYLGGQRLPRNTFAPVGNEFALFQNRQTQLDIRSVPLSGEFQLNGGAFPSSPGNRAAIVLRGAGNSRGDSIYLGDTSDNSYSTTIIPGHYRPIYNWAAGDLIPRNQLAELDCPRP